MEFITKRKWVQRRSRNFGNGELKDDLFDFLAGQLGTDPRDQLREATLVHDQARDQLSKIHALPAHCSKVKEQSFIVISVIESEDWLNLGKEMFLTSGVRAGFGQPIKLNMLPDHALFHLPLRRSRWKWLIDWQNRIVSSTGSLSFRMYSGSVEKTTRVHRHRWKSCLGYS